jgi:hypothetical protein
MQAEVISSAVNTTSHLATLFTSGRSSLSAGTVIPPGITCSIWLKGQAGRRRVTGRKE